MLGKYYSTSCYRKKLLEDLSNYISNIRIKLEINDIILMRDLSKNIELKEM